MIGHMTRRRTVALATILMTGSGALLAAPTSVAVDAADASISAEANRAKPKRPSAKAPSSVYVKSSFEVRVRLRTRGKRPIRLLKSGLTVARRTTNRRGKIVFDVQAPNRAKRLTLKVVAPRARGHRAWSKKLKVQVRQPTTTVTSMWGTTTVPLGGTIPVSGVVGGRQPAGRTVVVQQLLGGTWTDRESTVTAADGSFATALSAYWYFASPARVAVGGTDLAPPAAGSEVNVASTLTWSPGGESSSWSYIYGPDSIVVQNPCVDMTYRTNFAKAPAGAREALDAALASVTQVTGIRFHHLGETAAVMQPSPGIPAPEADTALNIAWITDDMSTLDYPPEVGGKGGPFSRVYGQGSQGIVDLAVQSGVNMNVDYHAGWTPTLMQHVYRHELGHVMGLGHTPALDNAQIMGAEESRSTNFPWGAGDIAGLQALTLQAGCPTPIGRPAAARSVPMPPLS